MKKIFAIVLAALMLLSLVACGVPADTTETPDNDDQIPVELPFGSAEELVGQIITKVPEENQVPGGGAVIELGGEDAAYTLTDLGLPENFHSKVDDAYQYRHMMNANMFSMGVFHFASNEDATAAVDAIKNTLENKEWICGVPEKIVVVTLPGNYVISMYGLGGLDPDPNFAMDAITPVIDAAKSIVDNVNVVVDQPVA